MFRFFETSLAPTVVPDNAEPPSGLAAFYWHFARQAKALFIGLFAIGFVVALLDVMIPVFIGKVVTLATESRPEMLLATSWPWLLGMAIVLLVLRPAAFTIQHLLIKPGDCGQRLQPHPVAKPLARLASVVDILPERFCRSYRHARDADRTGDP